MTYVGPFTKKESVAIEGFVARQKERGRLVEVMRDDRGTIKAVRVSEGALRADGADREHIGEAFDRFL